MKKTIKTQNPYSGKTLETYKYISDKELDEKLALAQTTFEEWRHTELEERSALLLDVAELLETKKRTYADLMTAEMGKPITQSIAEIEKCALLARFYAKNAENFLADAIIETDAHESFISYDPLGIILAVMPWNYPFWQVFRFALPTLTAGNTAVLKHASNVTGCALVIQDIFEEAGYPKGCFQTLLVDHDQIETVIKDERIKAVSLTGSEKAGKSIAEQASAQLKKSLLELGGNNACLILGDADLDKYMDTIFKARMQNTGQSCIAAKRYIVVEEIYDEFMERLKSKLKKLKIGDPTNPETELSVLARPDLAEDLKKQVDKSIEIGAELISGNTMDGAYFEPTILTNVKPGMPAFDEETFGPVASIIKVKDEDEAYKMASTSKFGLGSMVFTKDFESARYRISDIEDGAFFINDMVKSDPRLPFGGTKISGYGRELSKEGILEFVNNKTVYINK
ncbi:NAD-dependent succinate-semialdehyde dehydrogenase [Winogradskyella maritima]|uniref:NAD-dependent succinate-semialdehyde dehydrogenase n=1 Tax=Winogradskyella maritima TaxID=1517766 RepID=A0ABV8AN94_9FLAO|nr:NAD-dependent succinate-semialdehyde dehydrogenase [Winogradskyella maritima]